jgi:hypothetical protein
MRNFKLGAECDGFHPACGFRRDNPHCPRAWWHCCEQGEKVVLALFFGFD